jgi:hypothetical protein
MRRVKQAAIQASRESAVIPPAPLGWGVESQLLGASTDLKVPRAHRRPGDHGTHLLAVATGIRLPKAGLGLLHL